MPNTIENIRYWVKKRKQLRKLLKVVGLVFAFLLVLQISLLYFANPLLKNFVKQKIKKATHEVFEVDFDRISINLGTKSITLSDFKLIPNHTKYQELKRQGKAKAALYAINFSSLKIKDIRILRFLKTGDLVIDRIIFDKLLVRLIELPTKKAKDEKYDAIHKDLYPLISPFLNSLKINYIVIQDAYFDFFTGAEKHNIESSANSISIKLTDFYLDEGMYKANNRLFYAKNIELKIKDYVLGLKDSTHVLRAKYVTISSLQQRITARMVTILPEQVEYQELKNLKHNYLRVVVPKIEINQFNMRQIFFEKTVDVGSLKLVKPSIQFVKQGVKKEVVKSESNKGKDKIIQTAQAFDLYELIKGRLNAIEVKNFELQKASLDIRKSESDKSLLTKVGSLTVLLSQFRVDSLSKQRKTKVLYADDIEFTISDYRLNLADSLHVLDAEKLTLSTKNKQIIAQQVRLSPKKESLKNSFDVYVPELQLNGIDFRKLFNNQQLEIAEFRLIDPEVNVEYYKKALKNKSLATPKAKGNMYEMATHYLNRISIAKINFENGKFDIANLENGEKVAYSSGNLSLKVQDFLIDTKKTLRADSFFWAATIDCYISNYCLKLKNNLQILNVDSILLSTTDSILYIKGLRFKPLVTNTPLEALKHAKKALLLDASVEEIKIFNTDIHKAYFSKILNINDVVIRNPIIKLSNYPDLRDELKLQRDTIKDTLVVKKDIYALLSNYLKIISINNLNLDNGYFSMRNIDSVGKNRMLMDNHFFGKLENFYMNTDSAKNDTRLFFSKDIELLFKDFSLQIPDKVYDLKAESILVSTSKLEVAATNFHMIPKENIANQLRAKSLLDIFVPKINLLGVDIRKAYKERIIDVDYAALQGTNFKIKKLMRFADSVGGFRLKYLPPPKNIKAINIKNVEGTEGKFTFSKDLDSTIRKVFTSDFSFSAQDFLLDSAGTTFVEGRLPFSNTIELKFNNYQQKLGDSIHTLSAKELLLSSKDSVLSMKGFAIKGDTTKGKLEFMRKNARTQLYDVYADKINLKGFDIIQFYDKQRIDNQHFNLSDAKVHISNFADFRNDSLRPPLFQKDSIQILPSEINLYKLFAPTLKSVHFDDFQFKKVDFQLLTYQNNTSKCVHWKETNGQLKKWYIDSLSYIRPSKFYSADNLLLQIKDYDIYLPDSINKIHLGELNFNSSDSSIFAKNVAFSPRWELKEYVEQLGTQKTAWEYKAKTLIGKGVDYRSFLNRKRFIANTLVLDSSQMNFYCNKRLQADIPKAQPLFQTFILKFKTYLQFDTVYLKNSSTNYIEQTVGFEEPMVINTDSLNARITNLCNDEKVLQKNDTMRIDLVLRMMKKGEFEMHLVFPMLAMDSSYTYFGRMGSMDLQIFNSMTEKMMRMKFTDGKIARGKFFVRGNTTSSEGELVLRYNDLKIALLNKNLEKGIIQAVTSFLANKVIKNDNPKIGHFLRVGRIYSKRKKTKAFFSHWTTALTGGILSSLGLESHETKLRIKEERKLQKQEQKNKEERIKNLNLWQKEHDKQDKITQKLDTKQVRQFNREQRQKERQEKRYQRKRDKQLKEFYKITQ